MKTIVTIIFIILALIGVYFLSSIFSKSYSKNKVQNWLDINFPNTFQIISFEKAPLMLGNYYFFTVQDKDNIKIKGTIGFVKDGLIAREFSESYYYTQKQNTEKFREYYNESKTIKTFQRNINKDLSEDVFVEAAKFSPSNITAYSSTEDIHILVYSTIKLDKAKPLLKNALSKTLTQNNWDTIKFIYFKYSKQNGFTKKYPLRNVPEKIQTFEISKTPVTETQNKFDWRELEESQDISKTLFYLWQPQQKNLMDMSLYHHEFLD